MSAFESAAPTRSHRAVLVFSLIVIIGLCSTAWYFWPRFEREAPLVRLAPDSDALGTTPLEIVVGDKGAGLKSVTATLSSGGTDYPLFAEQYAQPVPETKITVLA